MTTYEIIFSEGDSIDAMSIVQAPAIEEDAYFLKTQKEEIRLSINTDKQEIIGAALIPDKKIYRNNGKEEYNIVFSKDTVKKAMENFMTPEKKNSFTLEHEEETTKIEALESWIMDDEDTYNLNAPKGSWILRSKVKDTSFWNNVIKAGKFSGYSLEGRFGTKVELADQQLEAIVSKIKEAVTEYINS